MSKKPRNEYDLPRIKRVSSKGRRARDHWSGDIYEKPFTSWDEWRSRNEPVHGCGHMQGRGAA